MADLVANNDEASTQSGVTVVVPILANDTVDGEPVTLGDLGGLPTITRHPESGSATINENGELVYSPAPGFTGTVTLEYMIETPEPSECVSLFGSSEGIIYYDSVAPDWWGTDTITIDVPSGSYGGAWDSEAGGYNGDWPQSCESEEGTVTYDDGLSDLLCVSWHCQG